MATLRHTRRRPVGLAVLGLLVLAPAACSSNGDAAEMRVLAARSLTEAFTELADAFELEHSGVAVDVSFAGTPTLVAQIEAGTPAAVFASADETQMDVVADAGRLGSDPKAFARNRLAIVVAESNPLRIRDLAGLAGADVSVALCAPEVPCGAYTRAALERAGVDVRPVTEEDNVKSVVSRVALGEVDAGVVYTTDIEAARRAGEPVAAIAIADAQNPPIVYPIAALADAEADADSFVEFVTGPQGQAILADHGFEPADGVAR